MSRRILLADDSVTIQKVIELTFMDDDYEVRAVGNGDEALAMLAALQVDFVIADVHMPGASGYEVCRRSKQLRPEVPVLLLVGTFEPFDEAQARTSGANSFLKKPFDSQELLARVHELLGATTPAAAAPAPIATAVPAAAAETLPPSTSTSVDWAPVAEPAAAAPAPGAGNWQEFELEAEPELELIPDPWEENSAASAAAVAPPAATAEPRFEQPFALGDLDAPEPQPMPAPAATAGFEAPSAPFGRVATGDHPVAFTLGGAGHEPFDLSDAPPGGRTERPTVAEPVFSFAPPSTETPSAFRDALPPTEEPPLAAATASPFLESHDGAPAAASDHGGSGGDGKAPAGAAGSLSETEVERIARRVVELIGDRVVREVAWEVIPDLAEVVIKDRLRELESQVE